MTTLYLFYYKVKQKIDGQIPPLLLQPDGTFRMDAGQCLDQCCMRLPTGLYRSKTDAGRGMSGKEPQRYLRLFLFFVDQRHGMRLHAFLPSDKTELFGGRRFD